MRGLGWPSHRYLKMSESIGADLDWHADQIIWTESLRGKRRRSAALICDTGMSLRRPRHELVRADFRLCCLARPECWLQNLTAWQRAFASHTAPLVRRRLKGWNDERWLDSQSARLVSWIRGLQRVADLSAMHESLKQLHVSCARRAMDLDLWYGTVRNSIQIREGSSWTWYTWELCTWKRSVTSLYCQHRHSSDNGPVSTGELCPPWYQYSAKSDLQVQCSLHSRTR